MEPLSWRPVLHLTAPRFTIKEQNPLRERQCGEHEEAQARRYGNCNALPTRWNREERDAETKGNAILDGNVPPPIP